MDLGYNEQKYGLSLLYVYAYLPARTNATKKRNLSLRK